MNARPTLPAILLALALCLVLIRGRAVAAPSFFLAPNQSCDNTTLVSEFTWRDANQPTRQWIDLSTSNNGFEAGTYVTAGPIDGLAKSFVWRALAQEKQHFARLVQEFDDGSSVASSTVQFRTMACLAAVPLPQTQAVTLSMLQAIPAATEGPAFLRIVGFSFVGRADAMPSGGNLQVCPSDKSRTLLAFVDGSDTRTVFRLFGDPGYFWSYDDQKLGTFDTGIGTLEPRATLRLPAEKLPYLGGILSVTIVPGPPLPDMTATVSLYC